MVVFLKDASFTWWQHSRGQSPLSFQVFQPNQVTGMVDLCYMGAFLVGASSFVRFNLCGGTADWWRRQVKKGHVWVIDGVFAAWLDHHAF